MARIRSIKITLYQNESLAELPPHARLLFPALWCLADREGRLEDRPKRIHALVFPYEPELQMDHLLNGLEANGFIQRYEVDGTRYIQISNFAKHQRPHPKEQVECPAPVNTPSNADKAVNSRDLPGKEIKSRGKVSHEMTASTPHTPLPTPQRPKTKEGGVGGLQKAVPKPDPFMELPPPKRDTAEAIADGLDQGVGVAGRRIIVGLIQQFPLYNFLAAVEEAGGWRRDHGQKLTVRNFESKVKTTHDWPEYQINRPQSTNGAKPKPRKPIKGTEAVDAIFARPR